MTYCRVTEQLFEIIRLLGEENRRSRDYGGVLLSHGEVLFLGCVARNPDGNVSALSERLGITKGAITQMADKLLKKELIEVVRREGNQKERYFRLTERGEAAKRAHERFHEQTNRELCRYISTLDDRETDAVFRFLAQLRQCVPFSEFECTCPKDDEEEERDESIAVACARTICRA